MSQTAPDSCTPTTRWERWSPTPSLRARTPGDAYSGEAAPGAPRFGRCVPETGAERWDPPPNASREPEGSRTASAPRSPHVRVPSSPAPPRDGSASIGGGGEFPSARSCIIESPSPPSSSRTAEGIPPLHRSAPRPKEFGSSGLRASRGTSEHLRNSRSGAAAAPQPRVTARCRHGAAPGGGTKGSRRGISHRDALRPQRLRPGQETRAEPRPPARKSELG